MGYPTPAPPLYLSPVERALYLDPTTVLVEKACLAVNALERGLSSIA